MKERVLILDDEPSIVDILGQCLADEGYECSASTLPSEALGRIREGGYALLLTDLKMPEMHGLEVVRQAKKLDPDLAIVVITAMIDTKNAVQAMREGADDYVLKPFNLHEITLSASRAIEKRALVLDNRRYQQELECRVKEATAGLEEVNRELRSTKEYLENLLHSTVDAIMTSAPDGQINFVNEGAIRMLGHAREELIGLPMEELFVGGAEESEFIAGRMKESAPLQNYETEFWHKDGYAIPVSMSISYVHHVDGPVVARLAICKDITEQKELERVLKEMSTKDSLTGLYNQRYFYERLASEVERARRQGHPLSLLLFDVDKFKTYNDCHGHLAGDTVLQTVGRLVLDSTRGHVDVGCRYGGDEFTVVLPEAAEQAALNIAERIRTTFEAKHFDQLTLSIGLMTYREGYSIRTFIQFADAMMYDAKRSGGNRTFIYRPEAQLAEGSSA